MNNYRKNQIFHLTYKGHYTLDIPGEFLFLGYCFEHGEVDNQEHTHAVIKFKEATSKHQLIKDLEGYVLDGHVNVQCHKSEMTAVGYHTGFGDKKDCGDSFVVIYPANFNVEKYKMDRHRHKKTDTGQAHRNKLIQEVGATEAFVRGYINHEKYELYKRVIPIIEEDLNEKRVGLPETLDNTWKLLLPVLKPPTKKRHYWIWSKESDYGKSTFAEILTTKYHGIIHDTEATWFTGLDKRTEFIVLDELKLGQITSSAINKMCDGTKQYPVIYGGSIKLKSS